MKVLAKSQKEQKDVWKHKKGKEQEKIMQIKNNVKAIDQDMKQFHQEIQQKH